MKLGSLFDGSGGFPLAGAINGITPVWASEIEPYPIAVTTARFPSMKHLGSITDINGGNIKPVDIITFGSPCQDLSIAGNQKGIENGERSSLFFQAIRIIKEMRDATNGVYPNYAVWENVPGAFSSNHGNDFRLVLEALASISDPTVSVPMPEKWQRSGEIVGDGYSIAWRTLDAQYWGVPKRRKRIYLVADFGSERAGQILFERESVCGNPAQSREAWEGVAEDAKGGVGGSCGDGVRCLTPWDCQSKRLFAPDGVWPTLPAMGEGGANNSAVVYPINLQVITRHKALGRGTGFGAGEAGDAAYTLQAGHEHGVVYALQTNGIDHADTVGCYQDRVGALCATDYKWVQQQQVEQDKLVVYSRQRSDELREGAVASCQSARQYKDATDLVVSRKQRKYIVRRLTPVEAARLQGFPDTWGELAPYDGDDAFWQGVYKTACEIKGSKHTPKKDLRKWYNGLHTDSTEYKMWGNGIALPCAVFVLGRIARVGEQR